MPRPSRRPARPSPSATLILIRQHRAHIETYLLRRSAASHFMPGTYVFPGGNLEQNDMDTAFWKNHVDLDEGRLLRTLGGDIDRMLPYAVAAIRETWEEAGVLLGSPLKHVSDAPRYDNGAIAFQHRIEMLGICLSISRMGRWQHWITPEQMPRRFDTYFFMTPVDNRQDCQPDNHETVDGVWINPRKALVQNNSGSLPLSPPTLVTLHQMLPFDNLESLLVESRRRSWPSPIMPRLWPLKKGALIVEPWDPDYARDTVCVDVDRIERDVLPVGAPFSRLWHHGGLCRPVRYPEKKGNYE